MIRYREVSEISILVRHLQVYEVAPSLFMIEVRKAAGDTLEYHKVSVYDSDSIISLVHIFFARLMCVCTYHHYYG